MKGIIVGGGITGLSAAWYIEKAFPHAKITLFEKQDRLGGYIATSKEGPFLFEKGPRTFQMGRSPQLLSLIGELGCKIIESDKAAEKRYIYHKGKLRTPQSFLPWIFPYLIREMFIAKGSMQDESIYDFASRRFSPKIAEMFFDPLTLGIYSGDIRKLSVKSCFPFLVTLEEQYGSVVRGLFKSPKKAKGLFTIEGGMEELIFALKRKLLCTFSLNTNAQILNEHEVEVNGQIHSADFVIDATPPRLPKKSLWVVHLAYNQNVLKQKAFGYLVPSREKESVLGAIFDSAIFPSQNKGDETRLTVMVREEEKEPLKSAIEGIKRHLSLKEEPNYTAVFHVKQAIPQFFVGCGQLAQISVNDCVSRGLGLSKKVYELNSISN